MYSRPRILYLSHEEDIIEQLKKLENDHESGESDITDIKNIASKLGGIACIWACVSFMFSFPGCPFSLTTSMHQIRADLKYIEGIIERTLSTPDIEVSTSFIQLSPRNSVANSL